MIKITNHFPMKEWGKMYSFASDCYGPGYVLCNRKFFEWQFQLKPSDKNAKIICGWDNGKLLGMHGYLPLLVHWGELTKPIQAAWTLYWMVRKQAPKGLGLLLTKNIQGMYPLVLSVNPSKIGLSFFKALGWSFFWRIPRYICILDKKQCIHMLSKGITEEELDPFIFKPKITASPLISEINLNKDNYHPEWQFYPDLAFGTVRSLEYLTWRYAEHPVFHYHIVSEGKAHRPAVCVYRIEQAFGLYEVLVGRIVDFFYPGDDQGRNEGLILIDAVLKHMKSLGCAYIDFICSNKDYGQVFIDLGGAQEPEDRQILPVRLTPIEQVIRHQNLVFSTSKEFSLPNLEDAYITKSDIGGDNPAGATDAERIKIKRNYEIGI